MFNCPISSNFIMYITYMICLGFIHIFLAPILLISVTENFKCKEIVLAEEVFGFHSIDV